MKIWNNRSWEQQARHSRSRAKKVLMRIENPAATGNQCFCPSLTTVKQYSPVSMRKKNHQFLPQPLFSLEYNHLNFASSFPVQPANQVRPPLTFYAFCFVALESLVSQNRRWECGVESQNLMQFLCSCHFDMLNMDEQWQDGITSSKMLRVFLPCLNVWNWLKVPGGIRT